MGVTAAEYAVESGAAIDGRIAVGGLAAVDTDNRDNLWTFARGAPPFRANGFARINDGTFLCCYRDDL